MVESFTAEQRKIRMFSSHILFCFNCWFCRIFSVCQQIEKKNMGKPEVSTLNYNWRIHVALEERLDVNYPKGVSLRKLASAQFKSSSWTTLRNCLLCRELMRKLIFVIGINSLCFRIQHTVMLSIGSLVSWIIHGSPTQCKLWSHNKQNIGVNFSFLLVITWKVQNIKHHCNFLNPCRFLLLYITN
jgi:hypothetical protein